MSRASSIIQGVIVSDNHWATLFPVHCHVTHSNIWRSHKKARMEPSNLRGHWSRMWCRSSGQTPDQASLVVTPAATTTSDDNSSVIYSALTVRHESWHSAWTSILNHHSGPMPVDSCHSIAQQRKWVSVTSHLSHMTCKGWLQESTQLHSPSFSHCFSALPALSKGCGFVLSAKGSGKECW